MPASNESAIRKGELFLFSKGLFPKRFSPSGAEQLLPQINGEQAVERSLGDYAIFSLRFPLRILHGKDADAVCNKPVMELLWRKALVKLQLFPGFFGSNAPVTSLFLYNLAKELAIVRPAFLF